MSSHKPHKSKSKLVGSAKPIIKGDVVLLSHKRIGVIRYIGEIPELIEKGIWYGIEIRMTAGTLGDNNGTIGNTQYFKCAHNEGLFVKLHQIQRRIEPKELLEKVVKLTKVKNSMHQLLNQSHAELSKIKKKFNISTSPKKHKKKHQNGKKHKNKQHRLSFDDKSSGSKSVTYTADLDDPSISDAPRNSLSFSISNDYSVTVHSQTNSKYSKYSTYRKNPNFDMSDDDTLPSMTDVIPPTSDLYGRTLSDNDIPIKEINGYDGNHHHHRNGKLKSNNPPQIQTNLMNRSQSVEKNDVHHSKKNSNRRSGKYRNNNNPFSNAYKPKSIPTIQNAAPIQVATPLKAKHKTDFKTARQARTKSQPQLIIAMNNELSPTSFEEKNEEIRSWNTEKVLNWMKSFAEVNDNNNNDGWNKLLLKIEQHSINGDDLLMMDETNVLSEQLGVDSPEIRYKIMSELSKEYQRNNNPTFPEVIKTKTELKRKRTTSIPQLINSSSSPVKDDDDYDAKVSPPVTTQSNGFHHYNNHKPKMVNNISSNNNRALYKYQSDGDILDNGKPFGSYQRLSLSSSPKQSKKVTFGHEYSASMNTNMMKHSQNKHQHFIELHKFFDKIDNTKHGRIDFNAFRYFLIESDPDVDPYKLTNDTIQKCFDEFDLTKNGSITIEEFIVVMGKTYLRGLKKSNRTQLTFHDINKYFVQLIKHFLKKVSKNISYNNRDRKRSISPSRSGSGNNNKPPPPPRTNSHSRSRGMMRSKKPPPPRREISPSRSKSYKYNGHNGHNGHKQPPPPR